MPDAPERISNVCGSSARPGALLRLAFDILESESQPVPDPVSEAFEKQESAALEPSRLDRCLFVLTVDATPPYGVLNSHVWHSAQ